MSSEFHVALGVGSKIRCSNLLATRKQRKHPQSVPRSNYLSHINVALHQSAWSNLAATGEPRFFQGMLGVTSPKVAERVLMDRCEKLCTLEPALVT